MRERELYLLALVSLLSYCLRSIASRSRCILRAPARRLSCALALTLTDWRLGKVVKESRERSSAMLPCCLCTHIVQHATGLAVGEFMGAWGVGV